LGICKSKNREYSLTRKISSLKKNESNPSKDFHVRMSE